MGNKYRLEMKNPESELKECFDKLITALGYPPNFISEGLQSKQFGALWNKQDIQPVKANKPSFKLPPVHKRTISSPIKEEQFPGKYTLQLKEDALGRGRTQPIQWYYEEEINDFVRIL